MSCENRPETAKLLAHLNIALSITWVKYKLRLSKTQFGNIVNYDRNSETVQVNILLELSLVWLIHISNSWFSLFHYIESITFNSDIVLLIDKIT